jgi:hypothetical protein
MQSKIERFIHDMALRNTMLKAHKQVILTVFVKPEINKRTWTMDGTCVRIQSPLSGVKASFKVGLKGGGV